jgi:NMD protein affecting ribosome stability and mRNA decay
MIENKINRIELNKSIFLFTETKGGVASWGNTHTITSCQDHLNKYGDSTVEVRFKVYQDGKTEHKQTEKYKTKLNKMLRGMEEYFIVNMENVNGTNFIINIKKGE